LSILIHKTIQVTAELWLQNINI